MNKKIYHFTTLDSYNKIESDGFIRASSSGKYGPGVYLTDLDPNEHNIEEISKILYTGGAKKNLQAGKLDHHFCLEISELHVKEERQNVYRYVEDYDLCLLRYRVISRGLIQEFGSGLIIAASTVSAGTVLYNLGAALYSHGTDGRMARTQELKTSLQTFLCSTAASPKFIPVVSEDGGSVQVCCSECSSSPVSDVYEGGYLFSSTIDEKQLQEQLREHETQELKMSLQAFLRITAAPLTFIPVVSKTGESVQVVCTMCSSPVSAVYKGEYIFPSTIDLEQLQEQLWKHEKMHHLKKALFAVLTVGCIYYAPVFSCLLGLALLGLALLGLALLGFTIATNLLRI